MSDEKTIDLYLIQSPQVVPDDDNLRGYNRDLLRAYKNSIPIQDVNQFIGVIIAQVFSRGRKIKKLVIGSHGTGLPTGYGLFYIGKTAFTIDLFDDFAAAQLASLRGLGHYFARDADVYIMACKTGRDDTLLRAVSTALGGVRVHGYTDYITTTNWWIFGSSVDDGTDDEGTEIVCWPTVCRDWGRVDPRTGEHPIYKKQPLK
jgi:hypothetical protein